MSNFVPKSKRNFPWREWVAAVLWLILIAIESTPWFSFQNTGQTLYQLLTSLFGTINMSAVSMANSVLREAGHVTGYGVLSLLLFRAWRATLGSAHRAAWALSWSVIAVFMTAAVASLDEWHQTFFSSRTGSIHDVYLDSAAALAAQCVIFFFLRKQGARLEDKTEVAVGQ